MVRKSPWASRRLVVGSLALILAAVHLRSIQAETATTSPVRLGKAPIAAADIVEHARTLADDAMEGRLAGSRGGRRAARYLEAELQELGLEPAGEHDTFAQDLPRGYRNLLARLPANSESPAKEVVLVGAHYDHVGFGANGSSNGPVGYVHNGADDNASGVAVLLETIEAMMKLDSTRQRDLLIAFWDGEEQGLVGSRYWVSHPTVPLSSIKFTINIDMVGRLKEGRLELGGTRTGYGLRRFLASEVLPEGMWLDWSWELQENSDHWPFVERQIPVVMLHTGLHEDYHRPTDDMEHLNRQGMRDIAEYLMEVLEKACRAEQLPSFREKGRWENTIKQKHQERLLAPPAPRLGIRWRTISSPDSADDSGAEITTVMSGSPADQAGLQVGDILLSIDNQPIENDELLKQIVQDADDEITLTWNREGVDEPQQSEVTLRGRPARLGVSWRADEAEPQTVFVTRVIAGSRAARGDIQPLDRIIRVNGEVVRSAEEFRDLIGDALQTDRLELEIERRGRILLRKIELGPAIGSAD